MFVCTALCYDKRVVLGSFVVGLATLLLTCHKVYTLYIYFYSLKCYVKSSFLCES